MSTRDRETTFGTLRIRPGLARITNIPVVISNVLAGSVIATPLTFSADLLLVVLAVALFSISGAYFNDILDRDRQEHSEEPLPTGPIPGGAAWSITIASAVIGLILLGTVGRGSFFAGMALIGVIGIYDAWRRGNPFGPVLMAMSHVVVYVIAFFAFATNATWELVAWCVVMLAYVIGLTLISGEGSDRGSGRNRRIVPLILPAIVALIMDPRDVLVWSLAVALLLWIAHSVSFAWRRSNRQVGSSIARLIAGISLVDALILATHEAWWGVLIAMACLAATMFLQRFVTGT